MQDRLQKAISLVQKTGDRLVVFNSVKSTDPYVIMSLDEYEKLAMNRNSVKDLTEDELLDKINRDIAVWKSEQDLEEEDRKGDDEYSYKSANNEENNSEIVPESKLENHSQDSIKRNPWSIPSEIKEKAEEVLDEDRQYLEEISF